MESLTDKARVKYLAKKYHVAPDTAIGQHFILSDAVLETMVAESGVGPEDTVLEIGPGWGALTVRLCASAQSVVAVELDQRVLPALEKLQSLHPNLTVHQGDILRSRLSLNAFLEEGSYKIVSNIPYSITSRILRIFLEESPRPSSMTLLVQKEVAERVVAKPGSMSVLSVMCQIYSRPRLIRTVPPDCFWPPPDVDSAMIHLDAIGTAEQNYRAALEPLNISDCLRIVKIGFSSRRKQLHNNLSAGLRIPTEAAKSILKRCRIQPAVRAQELTIEEWVKIAHTIDRE